MSNHKNVDYAIDWETMDNKPSSVVLSFAITPFYEDELSSFNELESVSKYWKFDVDSQTKEGRTIGQDTLDWWLKQDKEVYESQMLPSDIDVHLSTFVQELKDFIEQTGGSSWSQLYCRGADFDYPILGSIIENYSDEDPKMFPVPFWNKNDLRSYIRGMFVDRKFTKVPLPNGTLTGFKHHDPIHDCVRAAMHIQYARKYALGELDIPDNPDPNSNK
jgi:hypothetical protein